MDYINAFLIGGLICAAVQILMEKTKMMPGRIMVLLVCLGAWAAVERNSFMSLAKVEPKYMLLGGVMGAAITWTVIQSMKSLGPAKAVLFIVVAQILVAYLIELFGIFGTDKQQFEMKKMIGMALAIVGIVIFKWE